VKEVSQALKTDVDNVVIVYNENNKMNLKTSLFLPQSLHVNEKLQFLMC